jgi:tetratricopeptide (TPR) repeat protein
MPFKATFAALLAAVGLWAAISPAWAEPLTNQLFIAHLHNHLVADRQHWATNPTSPEAAWQVGRAAFRLADIATNNTQRATAARIGIAACRQAVARQSNSAPAHYFLAINLGQLAQAEAPSLFAYRTVFEVEREFIIAAELDVRFDHAGPARTLGLLYYQAPGWPLSVGSKTKAREWLERAAGLAPDHPENQLNLAEARLKWRQREEAAATLRTIEAIWPAAQTSLTGETWEVPWWEWNLRRAALRAQYQRLYHAAP